MRKLVGHPLVDSLLHWNFRTKVLTIGLILGIIVGGALGTGIYLGVHSSQAANQKASIGCYATHVVTRNFIDFVKSSEARIRVVDRRHPALLKDAMAKDRATILALSRVKCN